MSRNLDTTMSAHLTDSLISPAFFASFQFRSGVTNAWTGVGPFTWNGLTFQGVGNFGQISPITESSDVQADGMTVQIANLPFTDASSSETASVNQYLFTGGPTGQNSVAEQTIDISSYATAIDGGYAVFVLSGYLGGFTNEADAMTVAVNWLDASGTNLGSATIGPVTPAMRGNVTELLYQVTPDNSYIPATARSAQIVMTAIFGTGIYNDGYADLLSLTIDGGANLIVNPGAEEGMTGWTVTAGDMISTTYTDPNVGGVQLIASDATPLSVQSDIQLGAPAQIWFGLMSEGQLIGTPYLIFSGMVDQPTIDVDTSTMTVSLALENRLTNLARPSGRRYTAADQRLFYPDDIAFNWVEPLNDIALRWGS